MFKEYLEQRHITLASGRSSIALEHEYWKVLETLAYIIYSIPPAVTPIYLGDANAQVL